MSRKHKFHEKEGAYFISFATVFWINIFTRIEYFDIIIEALNYCRKNKGMIIFGYCIMPSHIHLIFRSEKGQPSELIYQFWQQNNNPIEIWTLKVFEQKLNYVHQNPVKAGFVMEPWEWKHSSARNYCDDYDEILEIDVNL